MKYHQVITPHKASLILGVCVTSLWIWEKQGKIRASRTPGGHRRYYLEDIMAIAAPAPHEPAMKKPLPQAQPQAQVEPHRGLIRQGIRRLLGKT